MLTRQPGGFCMGEMQEYEEDAEKTSLGVCRSASTFKDVIVYKNTSLKRENLPSKL